MLGVVPVKECPVASPMAQTLPPASDAIQYAGILECGNTTNAQGPYIPNSFEALAQGGLASNEVSMLTDNFDFSSWQAPVETSSIYPVPEQSVTLGNTGYTLGSAPVQGI